MKLLRSIVLILVALLAAAIDRHANAQSNDSSLPTPVLSNEINGRIAALDIGDPRLTRHFYAFEATPGDLIVTINSRNLNGDVDIFTAVTFRPLTKISIYANTIPPEVTKNLYFRSRQILILRVEARTPNDDPGAYRITLGGSFQPFSGGIPVAENTETESDKAGEGSGERLSSVGATLPKPPREVASEEPKPTEPAVEKPEEKLPTPSARRGTTRTTPSRNTRGRTPRRTRPTPPKTETAKKETEQPKGEETKPKAEETKPATEEGKSEEKPATGEKPAQETPPGPRLIIEQTDGTRIDRPMSTVRRVIVEANAIVIILKTGRTQRIPMSRVARMAIEP